MYAITEEHIAMHMTKCIKGHSAFDFPSSLSLCGQDSKSS